MVVVLLEWIYIMLLCTLTGAGVWKLLEKIKGGGWNVPLAAYPVAGMVAVTVYAEIFSIFGAVGMACHLLLLAAALLFACLEWRWLVKLFCAYRSSVTFWELFFYACFAFLIAYCASRGEFHTDTSLYHAKMIALYEDYGLVTGMGNVQNHLAYNSAYLAFAAFFSLKWLTGQSLHATTGFLEVFMCIYAFHGLRDFGRHSRHIADLMRVGILVYAFVILDRSMSPATDYGAMLFSLFFITAWCDNLETDGDVCRYGLLSVLAVFVLTLKFSAGLLVIAALYPAWRLAVEKRWREIFLFCACGLFLLLPFLFRNYRISGWLLYPFADLDLFQVLWKIPKEYVTMDSDVIKVWGRCLYDPAAIDWPLTKWLPVWWEHQRRDERMLLFAVLVGAFLLLLACGRRMWKKRAVEFDFLALLCAVYASLALWFFNAPFIRYGLAFLLAAVMIPFGAWATERGSGLYQILTGGCVFLIVLSTTPFLDNYVTEVGVFAKHSYREPYYFYQKDYDKADLGSFSFQRDGIYYMQEGELRFMRK